MMSGSSSSTSMDDASLLSWSSSSSGSGVLPSSSLSGLSTRSNRFSTLKVVMTVSPNPPDRLLAGRLGRLWNLMSKVSGWSLYMLKV